MNNIIHKRIHKEISEETGLDIKLVEKICDSQFEFTRKIMMEGKDEQVRLQYLGLFLVKPGRRETVRKRRDRIRAQHDKNRQKK